jgi:signal transduction histidine kinase
MAALDPVTMITPRQHPLRFLLYLEWVLLAIAMLAELLPASRWLVHQRDLNLVLIVALGILGLRIPTHHRLTQLGYLVVSFGLILTASWVGGLRSFQLLYVVLVIRSCLMVSPKIHSWITATAFSAALATEIYRIQFIRIPAIVESAPRRFAQLAQERAQMAQERAWATSISSMLLLGLVLVFLQLLINAALSERQSRQALALANQQLRQYALRVEDVATLQERNRIAREIHDSLGHSLTASNLHVAAALRLLESDPDEARELLLEAKQLGSTALQEVRQSVSTLRSDPLQGKNLAAAITALAEDFQRARAMAAPVGMQVQIQPDLDLPQDLKTAIYRIVQESLTNISKYAQATTVGVTLGQMSPEEPIGRPRREPQGPRLRLVVQDNGVGFEPSQNTSGFGLQGIQERTRALGGSLVIQAAPGQGCQLIAEFPLHLP